MSGKLTGRCVVVTGATEGIGEAAARLLAEAGAAVVATGRDAATGAALTTAIEAAGGRAVFVPHDVRSEADWARVADAAEAFGGLDGLVNNAGLFFIKTLAETTESDFDLAWETNVEGTFLGIKTAFAALARNRRAGSVVNVSSSMGLTGFPGAIPSCTSTGAVTALSKAAALEGAALSPKVRVNSLHPGVVRTRDDPALRTTGQPQDVAEAILFLVSDDSSYMTGAELVVDGGGGAN